jgi:hypothetical protein
MQISEETAGNLHKIGLFDQLATVPDWERIAVLGEEYIN